MQETKSRDNSNDIRFGLLLAFIFVLLAGLLITLRDAYLIHIDAAWVTTPYNRFAYFCDDIPACLRIGSAWSWKLITELMNAGIHVLEAGSTSESAGLTVSDIGDNAERVAAVLHRLLMLAPVPVAALLITRTKPAAILILVLAFAAMLGWSPLLYRPVIAFYSLFADWPHNYWDFSIALQFYDFVSVGFLFCLLIRLARPHTPGYADAVLLVLLGQFLFENLGIVAGIAVALRYVLLPAGPNRWKPAFYRLACSAATSVTLLAVMLALIQANKGANPTGHAVTLSAYFDSYRDLVAENIGSLPIIIANFINLMTLPLVIGGLAGLLLSRIDRMPEDDSRQPDRLAVTALSITAGFAVTICIGFFVNSYQSETGRQILPFLTMLTMTSCLTVRWLLVSRTRSQPA
ncbi:MAG: hypothetical protein RIC36_19755 [Rhodospirillales bacterium]